MFPQPEAIFEALAIVFSTQTLLWTVAGVTIGVGIGAIPGLSASSGVALMLPLSFQLETAPALGLLIGIYKGAEFGGSISAISFATPGTPAAAATVYDGYKMKENGQGRKAILTALYTSVTGDTLGSVVTIFVAPALALVALSFGPSERFWLVVLALTLLASLGGRHFAKGMLAAAIGLFLAMIGRDPIASIPRMTFGFSWLEDGIYLASLMIGIFALSRMIEEAVELLKQSRQAIAAASVEAWSDMFGKTEGMTFREYIRCWKEILIGFSIGSFVGMLPGLGGTAAAFLSYGVAKQASPWKKFGSGVVEGVAAPEAGNSATVGPALVPLLAFGIPGSVTAALIGGALTYHGAVPSPRMFELYPAVVYALFLILIFANFVNLGVGRLFAFLYVRLAQIPKPMLIPAIIMISIVGTYSIRGNIHDVGVMLFFGVFGFVLRRFGIPDAPLVITFLIGPLAESSLRRALMINDFNLASALFPSWLSISLCVATIALSVIFVQMRKREQFLAARPTED